MDERYIAAVDLGTSKIALTVARIDGNDVQILYYRETPADGIRRSYVFNPKRASVPVGEAIRQAEDELKIKILQVVVGLPRYNVRQESAPGRLERTDPGSCITQEEIDTLKSFALQEYPLSDSGKEVIFGAVAQSFSTDDLIRNPEMDVIGAVSDILEGNFKIFIGDRKAVGNLEKVFEELGVAIARTYFIPDVIAESVLSDEEKENGVALVEMGAGVTSVTIYQNMIMRHYAAIPFGAKNITLDIKHECGFHEALAENIKLGFGACLPDKLQSMSEKVIQINDDENGSYKQLRVKYLSEIITARQREILSAMLYEIEESGYSERLRNGIVITGGGAPLVNTANMLKEMSGYNVRVGFPRQKGFSCSECREILEPSAAASLGMVLRARKDTHLNCIEDAHSAEPAAAQQPEKEVEYTGTVFDQGPDLITGNKPAAPKKPRPTNLTWLTKAINKASKVTESLGGLYDSME